MKVGTDGVLLGAWAHHEQHDRILDIGSGSALISLMMAQRFQEAMVTGIELEQNSVEQSLENVAKSPFSSRTSIVRSAIQSYTPAHSFDLIVSNPPFFEGAYSSGQEHRDLARHTTGLSQKDLWEGVEKCSHQQSAFCVILPIEEGQAFAEKSSQFGWFEQQRVWVKGQESAKFKRLLMKFTKKQESLQESELILEEKRNHYTPAFTQLVKDFYLKL